MTIAFWGGLCFLALSLYLLNHAVQSLIEAKSSTTWPYVDGVILESRAVKWKATSNDTTLFVNYEHVVSGKTYKGTKTSFYALSGDEVLKLEKKHNSSKTAHVYYNPERSILLAGPRLEKPYSDVILASIGSLVATALTFAGYLGKIN